MDPFSVPVALDNQPSPPHSPPQQQPSVVFLHLHPSAAASPAAPPALNHPPYIEMIYAAIAALKEKGGSSKIAIGKHIEQTYSNLPANHSTLLTQHLQGLKNTGQLRMVKRSYKLPRSDVPVHKKSKSLTGRPVGRLRKVQAQAQAQPISNAIGETNAAVPNLRRNTRMHVGMPMKVQAQPQAQPISNANAAVPKLRRRTRRPVGRPMKVHAQVQLNPIGEANAAVPKLNRRTKRPVGRPRKAQLQAQPISNAIGEANAAVPKLRRSTRRSVGRPMKVQAQVQPILNPIGEANAAVPKSNRRTKRPVGRPRKVFQASHDEAVPQNVSLANCVRCLKKELQQARDDRNRQVQALTESFDLVKHRMAAANRKLKRWLREELQQIRDDCDRQMQALTEKLDLVEHQLRNSR